jgi:DNA-binding Lrp family transcriptional regulator
MRKLRTVLHAGVAVFLFWGCNDLFEYVEHANDLPPDAVRWAKVGILDMVGVTLAATTDSDEFATAADRLEPVTEVLHLAGSPDYELRVACRDTAELDVLLRTLRMRLGAADTETKIILRSGPPPREGDEGD